MNKPVFHRHNVWLPSGEWTAPEVATAHRCADAARFKSAVHWFGQLSLGEVEPPSVLDLGCLEGGYAFEFAKRGYQVTGLEIRPQHLERCRFLECVRARLEFVAADVRALAALDRRWDFTFASGILYHLEDPFEALAAIAKSTNIALYLHTHYAPLGVPSHFPLGALCEQRGYEGRLYTEAHDSATDDQLAAAPYSSWGNRQSFWPTKRALLQMLADVGFTRILEDHLCGNPKRCRVGILALK